MNTFQDIFLIRTLPDRPFYNFKNPSHDVHEIHNFFQFPDFGVSCTLVLSDWISLYGSLFSMLFSVNEKRGSISCRKLLSSIEKVRGAIVARVSKLFAWALVCLCNQSRKSCFYIHKTESLIHVFMCDLNSFLRARTF